MLLNKFRYPHGLCTKRSPMTHNVCMKYLMRLGWGIVIYAIMYLAANALLIYGVSGGMPGIVARLIILICVALVAGRALQLASWKDILPYSFGWALIVMGLDALLTLPLTGAAVYSNWNIWIGYALVVLLPLLAPSSRIVHESPTTIATIS